MRTQAEILDRGTVHTPAPLARWVAERVWREWGTGPANVLDPACGAGALLLALSQMRPAATPAPRLSGVDLNPMALAEARATLERVGLSVELAQGDALAGPAFGESLEEYAVESSQTGPALFWSATFADVADQGGFDVVLANPPYARERSARRVFRDLARLPLGTRWSEPRMDLWFLFLHRSLDLLKPGGLLAFLIPSFWLGGTGKRKLASRLRDETRIVEVALLERWPVFPEVFGRHMLMLARKEPRNATHANAVVRRLTPERSPPKFRVSQAEGCLLPDAWREETIPLESLFVERSDVPIAATTRTVESGTLGSLFEIRQGIAENPPRITRPLARRYGEAWPPGTGVFVLTSAELAALHLSESERAFVRPYYSPRSVERYRLAEGPAEWLLYLTKHNVPDLSPFPNLERHLARFRPLLEERREVQRGQLPWWGVHWPREERLFVNPRLLVPQMGAQPRAVFVASPAFVGFSTNVIVALPEDKLPDNKQGVPPETRLRALCGLLNSPSAERWFARHAKRRGVGYDIGGTLLRRFPWRFPDPNVIRQVSELVAARQAVLPGDPVADELELRIEALVAPGFVDV